MLPKWWRHKLSGTFYDIEYKRIVIPHLENTKSCRWDYRYQPRRPITGAGFSQKPKMLALLLIGEHVMVT